MSEILLFVNPNNHYCVQMEIEKTIPHRPPFLFLDAVLEIGETTIKANRLLRAEEPHFAGHYPGNPIMPGVLLCEAAFQAGAVLLVHRMRQAGGTAEHLTPVLSRIQEAKFKQMVRPGDEITIEVAWMETISQFHFLKGKISKEAKLVLTISFALALVDEKRK